MSSYAELLATGIDRIPGDASFTLTGPSRSRDVLGFSGAILFFATLIAALIAATGVLKKGRPVPRELSVPIAVLLGVLTGIVFAMFRGHSAHYSFDAKRRRFAYHVRFFGLARTVEWPFEDIVASRFVAISLRGRVSSYALYLRLASGRSIRLTLADYLPPHQEKHEAPNARAAQLLLDLVGCTERF